MTANPWRGDVEMSLNGKTCVLRPTFEALSRIEQELDTGLIALARKLSAGALTLEELAVIVRHCMEAASGEMPEEPILREALIRDGLKNGLEAVAKLLTQALDGFGDAA